MGGPKEAVAEINPTMATKKKSIKSQLLKPFQKLFRNGKHKKQKEDKIVNEKEKAESLKENIIVENERERKKTVKVTPVTELRENFKRLQIDKEKSEEGEEIKYDDEDEFKNFTRIKINSPREKVKVDTKSSKDDNTGNKIRHNARTDSNTSEDSGFGEKTNESDGKRGDVKLKTERRSNKTSVQTVTIARTPIRSGVNCNNGGNAHPYIREKVKQIHNVNTHTLSGGGVTVNPDITQIDEVLMGVDENVQRFNQKSHQEKEEDWDIAQEFINTYNINEENMMIGRVENDNVLSESIAFDLETFINNSIQPDKPSVFLTPPRSEALSPQSDNYRSNSEYTLSPERLCSDYEKYQEIIAFEEYPSCVTDNLEVKPIEKNKERASMTMKQFKDKQKEIANGFSKMECCQENRKCRQVFQDYLSGMNMDHRKHLWLKVSQMDVDEAYGVLQQILCNLSPNSDDKVPLSLFMLICEKVLARRPIFFVSDHGLNLLKAAVFLCHWRPIITRYLVTCIRTVTRSENYQCTKGHVFHEVDAAGDTLLLACVRSGDTHAPALAELVCAAAPGDPPLFDVHHANADGYTALHLACQQHSDAEPRIHTVHVLLQHAGADLWKGDIRGGDTAVHLAVNSVGCSLNLLLLLFKPLPRASWKKLAHAQNRSSVTPLEYARSAMKSATRQNYPVEVLDFLKKCR